MLVKQFGKFKAICKLAKSACRFCKKEKLSIFLDLGFSPPSNANLTMENLSEPEVHYPLRTLVCDACFLVQTEDFLKSADLFKESLKTGKTIRELVVSKKLMTNKEVSSLLG